MFQDLEIELTMNIENYQETIDKIKEVIVRKRRKHSTSMQEDMAKAYEKE